MKKLLYLSTSLLLLAGCGNKAGQGELNGVLGRPYWAGYHPVGTVYLPHGSFNMGQSDEDVPFAHTTVTKTVSVHAFYMDETEITNNEYRQFVEYVRDSIARRILAEETPEEYLSKTYDDEGEERDESQWNLDWRKALPYMVEGPEGKGQEIFNPLLAEMLLPENERYHGRRDFDVREFIFEYYWIDRKEAAMKGRPEIKSISNAEYEDDEEHRKKMKAPGDKMPFPRDPETPRGRDLDLGYRNIKGQNNAIRGHTDRSRFIIYERINVYPDTLVWTHDFTYSANDPHTNMYFWHPAYDDYPVVGVTWTQAQAFCVWRTHLLNNFRNWQNEVFIQDFRLPSEAEWEYASRGGMNLNPYPWGGPYTRTMQGCFLANFKPMRGRYVEDGGFYTVNVFSYAPNGYGLYNMSGNVAEWCNTAYDESTYEYMHDLNPEYIYDAIDHDPISMKRKVIRGGSWKDIGYFAQTGTRSYEYQDSAKSYVGFRCVQTFLGRGGKNPIEEVVPIDVKRR